ncbi:MAG: hypothetical protein D6722_29590 [Bacteroidetes bacterium]|nr:MAG: hypothetical protein D6722_29590 [Bacteroidota bacterium]
MLKRLLLAFCLVCAFAILSGQDAPKREFRAAWIATVKNIDWPPRAGMPGNLQQAALIEQLDQLQAHGINAVIFQVRPACDAFYDSPYEPWSEWLTGTQGQAPVPLYDPLSFIIEECHRRGMELHAWFNPYRAATDWDSTRQLADKHPYHQYPEWFVSYGRNLYFDPGHPAARTYVSRVIMDVVRRYDIDAVHFDDYFYPYRIDTLAFPDEISFSRFGAGYRSRDDWRRANVDAFVQGLRDSLLAVKPYVKFGISPFGVWRNQDKDPEGSATRAGQTSYDDLYADVRKWLREGWIDYVAPQAYFSRGYPPADFNVIVDWWRKNSYGRHVYIGHALYKIDNNHDSNWKNPDELPAQIRQVRRLPNLQGSIFFSAKWFDANPLGFADSLAQHYYAYPALVPVMPWIDDEPPLSPVELELDAVRDGIELRWANPGAAAQRGTYFVIYRAEGKVPPSLEAGNMLAVYRDQPLRFLDTETRFLRRYTYRLTALDRHHNESQPSEFRSKRRWSGLFRRATW